MTARPRRILLPPRHAGHSGSTLKALSRRFFQGDKSFIFHCAGGLRSALAAKTALEAWG